MNSFDIPIFIFINIIVDLIMFQTFLFAKQSVVLMLVITIIDN